MTEKLPSLTTHSAISNNALYLPSMNDAPIVFESADEEPYTIKCICDFSDDDGNTIYCEKCDTWQHIECFYPGRVDDASREDFDHSCADCKPRPLDRRHATERLKFQRQNKSSSYGGDKKIKRPPSKAQKKKSKLLESQTNGFYDHEPSRNGTQEHHPPVKKPKGNRSSLSTNSQSKKSPPFNSRTETNTQPPSPVQTPPRLPVNSQVHGYSDNFLNLYNQGPVHSTCTNSFASLSVSNSMMEWLRDQSRLFQDAGVRDKEDVFLNLKVSVDTLKWPELVVERKEEAIQNTILHWQYLITPHQLPQPGRIVELNGLVGFQKDYCSDPENSWTDYAHPRPFVFFHPRLPLFIDTRREGSIGRYVRRSCRSNTSLETFIANGTEYHFWLTSEQPLSANEQITLSWDFRFPPQYRARFLHLLNLGEEDGLPSDSSDITHEEYEKLTLIIHLVLSEHGGCACDLGHDCAFVRFHRNYPCSSKLQNNEARSKKVRRTKQPQLSPTSVGNTMAIRVLSDNKQHNHDEEDNQSTAGFVRSKPQSRDLTHMTTNGDINNFLIEPSDREKRKLAMLEDSFRKMEQSQPARKKKRASESISTHSPSTQTVAKSRQRSVVTSGLSTAKALNPNNTNPKLRQLDTSSPKQQSGSTSSSTPSEIMSHSVSATPLHESPISLPAKFPQLKKSQYNDASTQTDEVKDAWWREPKKKKRKSIVSLARRLLINRYRKNPDNKPIAHGPPNHFEKPSITLAIPQRDSNAQVQEIKLPTAQPCPVESNSPTNDTSTVLDVKSSNSCSQPTSCPTNTCSPLSWPNLTNNLASKPDIAYIDVPPDLQAPLLTPLIPLNDSGKRDSNSTSQSTVVGHTPSNSGTTNNVQQPLVNGITLQPSPIKTTKKLSLSDYKAARLKKTDLSALIPKMPIGEKIPELNNGSLKSSSMVTIKELKTSVTMEGSEDDHPPIEQSSISATS